MSVRAMTPTITVKCRTCGRDFTQRENLLSGEWLWFPNCKCGKANVSDVVVVRL